MAFAFTYDFFLQEALPPPSKYLKVYFHSFKLHFLSTSIPILYRVYLANNFLIKKDKDYNYYLGNTNNKLSGGIK